MEDPAKLPLMVSSIQGILNMFTTQTKPTGQPQAVALSGVPNDQDLINVIDALKRKDPQLLQHLQKLAALPDPVFKQLIAILDGM
jgi:hypothetical protein